jgi:hypothetical protein
VETRSRRKYIIGRKGKEWLKGSAAGHVLTDMTSRFTVTEDAKADAALGETGRDFEGRDEDFEGWDGISRDFEGR